MLCGVVLRCKMGGPEVVNTKDAYKLKHVFAHIGACLVGAIECKQSKSPAYCHKYHLKKAKKWEKVALALKKTIFHPGFSMKDFKAILVLHFKDEILNDLAFLKTGYHYKLSMKQLDAELEKWINDDKYFEHLK
jgi:hypothetical protein